MEKYLRDPSELFEWVFSLLRIIQELLARVGIELTEFALQIFLFVLLSVVLGFLIVSIFKRSKYVNLIPGVAVLFVILAIVWHWFAPEGPLTPRDKEKLAQQRSVNGQTLFLLPYQLEGFRTDVLERDLHRGVTTYLQERQLRREHQDVSLHRLEQNLLPPNYTPTDTEIIKAIGEALNALAVVYISGRTAGSGAETILSLQSRYRIIPSTNEYTPKVMYIDDFAPTSVPLYQEINKKWGHGTVLAIAIKEYVRAKNERNRDLLEVIREYLVTERSRLGNQDRGLAEDLTKLIELCDKGLGM